MGVLEIQVPDMRMRGNRCKKTSEELVPPLKSRAQDTLRKQLSSCKHVALMGAMHANFGPAKIWNLGGNKG